MSLVTLRYQSRRSSFGPGKLGEMAGDYRKMIEGMARTVESGGDFEEAARLRALLRPQPIAEVQDDPVDEKSKRIRPRKPRQSPAPSLTRQQKTDRAWEELRLSRE